MSFDRDLFDWQPRIDRNSVCVCVCILFVKRQPSSSRIYVARIKCLHSKQTVASTWTLSRALQNRRYEWMKLPGIFVSISDLFKWRSPRRGKSVYLIFFRMNSVCFCAVAADGSIICRRVNFIHWVQQLGISSDLWFCITFCACALCKCMYFNEVMCSGSYVPCKISRASVDCCRCRKCFW